MQVGSMTRSGCDTMRRWGKTRGSVPSSSERSSPLSLSQDITRQEDCGNVIIISRKRKSSSPALTEVQSMKTVLLFVEMVDRWFFGFHEKGDSALASF